MMQAICEFDPMHNEFYALVNTEEEWVVDPFGENKRRVRLVDSWGPGFDQVWTCAACGRQAVMVEIPEDVGAPGPAFNNSAWRELVATLRMHGEIVD